MGGATIPVIGLGMNALGAIGQQRQQAQAAAAQNIANQRQLELEQERWARQRATTEQQLALQEDYKNFSRNHAQQVYQQEQLIIEANKELALQKIQQEQQLLGMRRDIALADLRREELVNNRGTQLAEQQIAQQEILNRLGLAQTQEQLNQRRLLLGQEEKDADFGAAASKAQTKSNASAKRAGVNVQAAELYGAAGSELDKFIAQFAKSKEDEQRLRGLFAGSGMDTNNSSAAAAALQNMAMGQADFYQQQQNAASGMTRDARFNQSYGNNVANIEEAIALGLIDTNRTQTGIRNSFTRNDLDTAQSNVNLNRQLASIDAGDARRSLQMQALMNQYSLANAGREIGLQYNLDNQQYGAGRTLINIQSDRNRIGSQAGYYSGLAAADAQSISSSAALRANLLNGRFTPIQPNISSGGGLLSTLATLGQAGSQVYGVLSNRPPTAKQPSSPTNNNYDYNNGVNYSFTRIPSLEPNYSFTQLPNFSNGGR